MPRSSVVSTAVRVDPGPGEQAVAAQLRDAASGADGLVLRLPDGQELALPEALGRLLLASADELSGGHAVTVLASEVLLTPAEVGRLLGLSRPYVARLLDDAVLASEHLPGSRHRVVKLADLLQFQARRDRRRTGRQRIGEAVRAADLPY